MIWAVAALALLLCALLCVAYCLLIDLSEGVENPYEPEYIEEMHPQDETTGYAFQDLWLLAKIMQAESRKGWPDWAVMCIGEVVLNRVASPLFPNTIREVLYQTDPIQYAPVYADGWDNLEPDTEYIDIARRLLEGERAMHDPDVVWQALYMQGTEIVQLYHDDVLDNTTYFCK